MSGELFEDSKRQDLHCQACGGYVGSYERSRAPKRALCPACAARRLQEYWTAAWARPAIGDKEAR